MEQDKRSKPDADSSAPTNLWVVYMMVSADTARASVEPFLTTDESGHLFPFAPGDNRRIKKDSPQTAINAASFLVAMLQSVRLFDEGDHEGAFGSMFGAGCLSHEVMLAARHQKPAAETLASYEEKEADQREANSRGGSRSSKLTSMELGMVFAQMTERTKEVSAAKAANEISRLLNAGEFPGVQPVTITPDAIRKRWSNRNRAT